MEIIIIEHKLSGKFITIQHVQRIQRRDQNRK